MRRSQSASEIQFKSKSNQLVAFLGRREPGHSSIAAEMACVLECLATQTDLCRLYLLFLMKFPSSGCTVVTTVSNDFFGIFTLACNPKHLTSLF